MNTDKILAEAIAKDYAPKDNSKIVALKKLDKKAKLPATIFTYTFGIISALIVGTGMSLAMQAIGSGVISMVAGIVIGIFLPPISSVVCLFLLIPYAVISVVYGIVKGRNCE